MIKDQISGLEKQLGDSKIQFNLGASLARLQTNRDFKELIEKAYLHDEAVRLVHLRAHPEKQNPEDQASILRDIDAIGSFHAFLRNTVLLADMASKGIKDAEDLLEELRSQDIS